MAVDKSESDRKVPKIAPVEAPTDRDLTGAGGATESISKAELKKQLAMANQQLLAYARDLKKTVESERERSSELVETNRMLMSYAKDLKGVVVQQKNKNRQLEEAYTETVLRLMQATQLKDDETGQHLWRVSCYSRLLAAELGWNKDELELIRKAAPLHDVGKIGIPGAILRKKGPLDRDEWQIVKEHPRLGSRLLQNSASPLLRMAEQISLTHHERWDGSGYPQGLRGDQIPMAGQIVMLADQYDALRSKRPYKRAFDHATALKILVNGDGRTLPEHFAPQVLSAFRRIQEKFDLIWQQYSSSEELGLTFELEPADDLKRWYSPEENGNGDRRKTLFAVNSVHRELVLP